MAPTNLRAATHPELVIGLAGAIGIDITALAEEIASALKSVGYDSRSVRVTDAMFRFRVTAPEREGTDPFNDIMYKMSYANKLCEEKSDPAFLMRVAIQQIARTRQSIISERVRQVVGEDEGFRTHAVMLSDQAYIVRQLKRPQEVELLRKVYGKQFILISAYGTDTDRRARLRDLLEEKQAPSTEAHVISDQIEKLINRDLDEGSSKSGQHLRDTFHLADVFIDGIERENMRRGLDRFFQAFFGRVDIGPSRWEYGMYAAKSASLRSTDLSRQVGAALFSTDGVLTTQGCNEVPRAFGGTYWDGETPDYRDVRIGHDPNDRLKRDVVRDLLERLSKAELLRDISQETASGLDFTDILLGKSDEQELSKAHSCLKDSRINDLTEYGRVVHAEMSAICDAARTGRSVKDGTLFVTTFPCHNCTKHIISSGVKLVVFMEPYPKSQAEKLHNNEIKLEEASTSHVSFLPFMGISPFRYRDIFEKKSRKISGRAKKWYDKEDLPRPQLEISYPSHTENENIEVASLLGLSLAD